MLNVSLLFPALFGRTMSNTGTAPASQPASFPSPLPIVQADMTNFSPAVQQQIAAIQSELASIRTQLATLERAQPIRQAPAPTKPQPAPAPKPQPAPAKPKPAPAKPKPAPAKPKAAPVHPAPAPSGASFGSKAVAAARQLMKNGYHYTVNLTSDYHPVRFHVGCCADFAVDSWAKAGIDLYHKVSNPHYCPTLVSYFKSGKDGHHWIPKRQACKPGDMVFFDWGDGQADHVAIVSAVGPDGKPSKIVESYNFNLPVHEITLGSGSKNCIIGYGRA